MFFGQFTDVPGKFRWEGHDDTGGEVFTEIFVVIFQGIAAEQIVIELFEDSFRDKFFILLHTVIHVSDADAAGILMVQEKIIQCRNVLRRFPVDTSKAFDIIIAYASDCFLVIGGISFAIADGIVYCMAKLMNKYLHCFFMCHFGVDPEVKSGRVICTTPCSFLVGNTDEFAGKPA